MARPNRVTVGAVGSSSVIPLNTYANPFNLGIGCDVSTGGSLTYTVEHTFDDVQKETFNPSSAKWFSQTSLTTQTAGKVGSYVFPVTAVRLTVTAWTSGSVTMTVIQSGY